MIYLTDYDCKAIGGTRVKNTSWAYFNMDIPTIKVLFTEFNHYLFPRYLASEVASVLEIVCNFYDLQQFWPTQASLAITLPMGVLEEKPVCNLIETDPGIDLLWEYHILPCVYLNEFNYNVKEILICDIFH